eukprot:CAMPEP_0204829174 /NCGR_PEP_ID=MMETSP1346-20131115/7225_1 /ASSEMBLY_ACC=CAM_ASM_000771 /TAXON_ID=215587 /ORGANISM="Aplanochytrium stocchinoi, Strain GSBS06" /LENGTH=185 /DNA_ID=CAMNT_0051958739 /DNA_START=93 /DNA_END=650 /DNA_ORIENTATION=+
MTKKNVEEYVRMSDGYDGAQLITVLKDYLKPHSSILELGMGPGKDLELLSQLDSCTVTGSDTSPIFLDLFREKHPQADVMLLDAVTMETDRRFDCVYSNKVLQHLSRDELKQSLSRQASVLNKNGILFHSLWYGDKEEHHSGLLSVYYTSDTLKSVIGSHFQVLAMEQYDEMNVGDSMYVILRKK